ncbi:alkaline phosphatase D family protein [Algiphilus sp. W345]|uniref:Alkaline phosphatase D family protein n=1 Tax=Banduia mediterranea TaxID=3075609 RepID=A0ABU2WFY6_9GAMM|nr:alkaline phosphatase D family protein [Algiphilus sp. W345]MDT0496423.1 alkaline phosphatase D family protein [Algiphilus sp. W345]
MRAHDPPRELLSLDDYRRRYAQYRSDADLQALHAAHPMIWIWDDHEIINDAWKDGADNHDAQTEGDHLLRRATAAQVAHEWLPIRSPSADEPIRATRNVVIFTGDAHESYAFDVTDDPNNPAAYARLGGDGAAAAEFVAPSITSRGDAEPLNSLSGVLDAVADGAERLLRVTNPHLRFFDNRHNGYVYARVAADRLSAEFWHVPQVREPTDEQVLAARFDVQDGRPGVVRA